MHLSSDGHYEDLQLIQLRGPNECESRDVTELTGCSMYILAAETENYTVE